MPVFHVVVAATFPKNPDGSSPNPSGIEGSRCVEAPTVGAAVDAVLAAIQAAFTGHRAWAPHNALPLTWVVNFAGPVDSDPAAVMQYLQFFTIDDNPSWPNYEPD